MERPQKGLAHVSPILSQQVLQALRRITRAIDLRSSFLATHYGLTGPQLTALKELATGGPMPVGQLAQAIHLSQATTTGIIARLGKRGFVRRQRSEADRRQVLVSVTDAGQDMLKAAPPALQESFLREFGKITDWEQTQILSALQRVVAMMEAREIDASPMLTSGPIDATPESTQVFFSSQKKDNMTPPLRSQEPATASIRGNDAEP